MTKSRFWADWSTREFAQLDPARTVAVLPLGATEQHGPHLPLSVDQVLVDGIIAAALPHLPDSVPVLFLPTQQVGYSPEHARFDGTLTPVGPRGHRDLDRAGRERGALGFEETAVVQLARRPGRPDGHRRARTALALQAHRLQLQLVESASGR